jgi:hypothetical protein
MPTETSQSTSDPIWITEVTATEWVESITLPTYSQNRTGSNRRFVTLQRNYAFIKHMMAELEIANNDFLIVRDIDNTAQITIKFNKRSQSSSSMAVLLWSKYKDAKLESNL